MIEHITSLDQSFWIGTAIGALAMYILHRTLNVITGAVRERAIKSWVASAVRAEFAKLDEAEGTTP